MPRNPGYTADELDRIREMAKTQTDSAIAEALGFLPGKVLHIRQRNQIPSFYRKRSPAHLEAVRVEYIEKGRPAAEVAAELGTTATNVRRIAFKRGWKRDKAVAVKNAGDAIRRYLAAHPRPKKPKAAAKPFCPVTRHLSADDATLIAEFMTSKSVTVLPPGQAAGISQWEMLLGTARPAFSSPRDVQARGNANRIHRLRLEAAQQARAAA